RPQLAEHCQPGWRVDVEVVVVGDDVDVRAFGHIHGHVGSLQEEIGAIAVAWCDGNAAAGLNSQAHAVDVERFLEEPHDSFGHFESGAYAVNTRKQHAELVTTQPSKRVGIAETPTYSRADLAQHLIA